MMIQGIRYSNIKHPNPKKRRLDLRVGHNNLPLNIVGVVYNPSHRILECCDTSDLIDIRTINKNGYNALIQLIENMSSQDNNLYYWLFDRKIDIVKLDKYKNISSLDSMTFIENMLGEIYTKYMSILK